MSSIMDASSSEQNIEQLQVALRGLFRVEQVQVVGPPAPGVDFGGQLLLDADSAYPQLRDRFAALGYTVFLKRQGAMDIVRLRQGLVEARPADPRINLLLFLLTIVSTLFFGAIYEGFDPLLDPAALARGIPFSFTVLAILGTHEMGHYIVARRHNAAVTLPYFIPWPFPPPFGWFGTMGAVIVQRSPFQDRKSLFDVGVAGPLAGLMVAIPLVIIGLATSPVKPLEGEASLFKGNSILYLGLKYLVHGKLLPSGGEDVYLNSVAWGAWFGLLVTFLNLLPLGQLDGGHVLYALLGRRAWPLAGLLARLLLIVGAIGLAGELAGVPALANNFWGGWFLWGGLALWMNPRHPPPLNDISGLGRGRTLLGIGVILLFCLLFMRMPFSTTPVLF